jgi:16S rRNA (adenine1518-N6/adenine1519-N6)-dimethyltransferase
MRVKFRPRINAEITDESLLWEAVSAGFAQKRKTILNNLRHASGRLQEVLKRNGGASIVLCKAGIDLKRRAETLTVEEWIRIVQSMT